MLCSLLRIRTSIFKPVDTILSLIIFTYYPPCHHGFRSFAGECDGFVSASSAAFEQKSLGAMRTWLGETDCPVYAVGPLMPPGFGGSGLSETAKQMEIDSSNKSGEFQAFLEKTLKSHGTRSLIYVCHSTEFGLDQPFT